MKQRCKELGEDGKSLSLWSLLFAVIGRLIHDIHRENPRENRIIRRCDSFGARREPMVIFLWLIILCILPRKWQTIRLEDSEEGEAQTASFLCEWSSAILMTPYSFAVTGRVHGYPWNVWICHCGETLAQAANAPRQTSAPVYHELGT